jgi:hypothetical protein
VASIAESPDVNGIDFPGLGQGMREDQWRSYSPRESQAIPVPALDQRTRIGFQALTKWMDQGHPGEVRQLWFLE